MRAMRADHQEGTANRLAPVFRLRRLGAVGLAVIATAWAAGCGSEPVAEQTQPPEGTVPRIPFIQPVPPWQLEEVEAILQEDNRTWRNLSADCTGMIQNVQIQTPNNNVRFTQGKLYYEKPGHVYLRLGYGGEVRARVVGNGTMYRTDLQAFNDAYSGSYAEAPTPTAGRISLLAPDLAMAFDPVWAISSSQSTLVPTLVQWEQLTALVMLTDTDEGGYRVWPASDIWLDRRTRRIETIEKYRSPGFISVRARYFGTEAVRDAEGNAIRVPNIVTIQYPEEQTTISLRLTNIKLDGKLPEDIFDLTR